jgi:hypothetical protein
MASVVATTAFVHLAGSLDARVIHAASRTSARPPGKDAQHHHNEKDDPPEHVASSGRLPAATLHPANPRVNSTHGLALHRHSRDVRVEELCHTAAIRRLIASGRRLLGRSVHSRCGVNV